jgi:hypothetical protein
VAFSVLGDPFRIWIKKAIEDRNLKVAIQKDLNINLDPELAMAFRASTSVSRKYPAALPATFALLFPYLFFCSLVVKGSGVMMLKVGSKRRRTTNEIKEEKEEARVRQTDVEAKLASLAAM